MSKYEPLEQFLKRQHATEVPMTFAEIEKIIGRPLPEKASAIRAWWSNNPSNNVMTKAWIAAGYVTERVDMASRKLVFRRNPAKAVAVARQADRKAPGRSAGFLNRIRSRLEGTVTVPMGSEIVSPIGESWDADQG